jgi:secondary thiamine-phosphate synthase enzyme
MIDKIELQTNRRTELIDITDNVRRIVIKRKVTDGVCYVYVPHTTAGVTVNEHADLDVAADIEKTLDRTIPWDAGYAHTEGNSAAHIKTGLTGTSQAVFIADGRLLLGTWQGIFFAEFDGPRNREVWIKIIKG